jgi:hypothetical protein
MASSRAKNTRKSLKRRVRSVQGPPTDRRRIVDLLKEMHNVVLDTPAELGVSAADRRRALALAGKDKRRRRPSLSIQPRGRLAGVLTDGEFRVFSQSIRQQLKDLCDRVDAGIQQPRPRGKTRATQGKSCGIGVYVFRDDGRYG